VGTGVGAAGGAAAGAAVGSTAGPIGTLAGGVVGAIAGGLAGKEIAENANPTEAGPPSEHAADDLSDHHLAQELGAGAGALPGAAAGGGTAKIVDPEGEDRHWSDSYQRTAYHDSALSFDDDRPPYQLGYRARAASEGTFEQAERRLSQDWALTRGESRLTWEQAKLAARDAWNRATV